MNLSLLSFWCVKGHCIQAYIVDGLRGNGGYVDGVYDYSQMWSNACGKVRGKELRDFVECLGVMNSYCWMTAR